MIDPTQPLQAGAQPGNNFASKFKTPAERQALCASYCKHRADGFSKESFRDCDMQTFKKYRENFPEDFDTDMIDRAEKDNLFFWEEAGIEGMKGKIKGYNSDSWKFNMSNRFKWKMREDVTTDDKEVVGPIVYMPKEEA